MQDDSKAFLHRFRERLGVTLWRGSPPGFYKIKKFIGAFVSAFWTPLAPQKAGQSPGFKSSLGDIERLPTGSKGSGNLSDGLAFYAVAPKHFILGLYSVARIEEIARLEKFILDDFRMRMQRAIGAQGLGLGILGR